MAYSTGTAANLPALRTIIENFAVANGFTLNAGAGSWLSKGGTHVKLTTAEPMTASSNNITFTTNTAHYTSEVAHGLTTGNLVTVIGATIPQYNVENVAVTVTGTTTFDYTMASTPSGNANSGTTNNCWINAYSNSYQSPTILSIFSADNSTGTSKVCPYTRSIVIPSSSWNVTYYLYYNSSPDQITCVIQYDSVKIQMITFGDYVPIHTSAFTGTNWFHASMGGYRYTSSLGLMEPGLYQWTDTSAATGGNYGSYQSYQRSLIPFTDAQSSSYGSVSGSGIHCEIDGEIWNTWTTSFSPTGAYFQWMPYTISLLFRSPNSWNNQANLVPMHIGFSSTASSGYIHYVGYIEHLRFIRIDNYELGDEIIIGSDHWMVFPWYQKNTSIRNGTWPTPNHSGTIGFAVRKT